jgi:putative spermidine/putrescine transport system permease protein
MYLIGKSDSQISIAVGLASLVFAFLILFAMSFVGGARSATSPLARLRRHHKEPT